MERKDELKYIDRIAKEKKVRQRMEQMLDKFKYWGIKKKEFARDILEFFNFIEPEFDTCDSYNINSKDHWSFSKSKSKICDFHCVNTRESWGFSKNEFVNDACPLAVWSWKNKDKDCYMNYNPLKTTNNRKNENVIGINMIALDIEFTDKKSPESYDRMLYLIGLIRIALIERLDLKTFMIIDSGNGFHLYAPIGEIIVKDLETMKVSYNKFVRMLNREANEILIQKGFFDKDSKTKLSCDDRVDLAGILRIPGTTNTKAKKIVKIVEIKKNGENKLLRKRFFGYSRKIANQMKKRQERLAKIKLEDYDIEIPETIEELESHPIVQMMLDYHLPDVDGWHTGPGFALQALAMHSGIPKMDLKILENDINSFWNSSLSLSHCNADDVFGPLMGAYNFCKKNGQEFDKYRKALAKILFKNKS